MRRGAALLVVLTAALGSAACHRGATDPTAVTADEERQLNEAAATLDAAAHPANDAAPDDGGDDNRTDDPS